MKQPEGTKMTRRQLAGVVLAGNALAQATTETGQPSGTAGELQAAREQHRRGIEAVARVDLPMATEPAFHFTA